MQSNSLSRSTAWASAGWCAAAVGAAFAALIAAPRDAHAQAAAADPTLQTGVGVKKAKPSDSFPLSGSVRVNPAVYAGSFQTGPGARPAADLYFGYSLRYRLGSAATLTLNQLFIKVLQTTAEADAARPNDTSFGDMLFALAIPVRVTNAKGQQVPLVLPGGVRMSLLANGSLGLSRTARYLGRYGALGGGVALSRPGLFGMLTLSGNVVASKSFLRDGQAGVPAEDGTALARPGGAELLDSGYIATGLIPTSFSFRYALSANLAVAKRVNIFATYLLFNVFRTYAPEDDAFTARYARVGRGRADFQWGIFGASYDLDEEGHFSASLSTFVASLPWSADNQTLRFPFWDFRSPSSNIAQIGAELSYSF